MEKIGQIEDRKIYYLSVNETENWVDKLPNNNWLVAVICDKRDAKLLEQVTKSCLEKGVLYVCTMGQECEWAHDYFDEMVFIYRLNKKLPISSPEDFDEEPMTTWHNDLFEGLRFATTSAFPTIQDEYISVDKVVCIDLSDKPNKQTLKSMTLRINQV